MSALQNVSGTWWGLPDFGLTEWARSLLGKTASAEETTTFNNPAVIQATSGSTAPASSSAVQGTSTQKTTDTKDTTNNGSSSASSSSSNNGINDAAAAQQKAAEAAAEAKRQSALRSYNAKVAEAGVAKEQAKGQYDWLIEALGSNKTDLLNQVALNETTGIQNYETQQKQTTEKYTTAKQEILQTYRDLQTEQEKIMRGSGQGQSSRAQEATLRLNNLLGKDMSNITTNEADSLALIGNALTAFKTNTLNTKTSIEKDTASKIDKATLDYNQQIQTIDMNLNLSANEREDRYAEAEATLASDTAKIQTWAAQQKLVYEETVASQKGMLDDYIVQMTDADDLLNSDLDTKNEATNKLKTAAGLTTTDTETGLEDVSTGVYQSSSKTYSNKEDLDSDLAAGKITALEYSQQLAKLQGGTSSSLASTSSTTSAGTTLPTSVANDPLLSALFA